ncbi:OsmC family protein [Enterococcus hermanniensis]|uniref:OsmC-like protein n=1 Tax=Enterococcus hermanniensis TaxID=249189 RepID=A0A1L8TQ78_9ENTE|nr:OsmC family protein [Enterococcus hermanniensis]OJG46430.1 OsmC-like protein [Enterococcus hermanniensis]
MAVEMLEIYQLDKNKFEMHTKKGEWILTKEKGYSPVQMLVSSVAACGGYVYSSILENSKIEANISKIEVSYRRSEQKKAEPISEIHIKFIASIPEIDHKRALRCLKLIPANCPVMQSLDPTIQVTETVVFI